MSTTVRPNIISLYRSLLRESGSLPTPYLRLFFRVKFREDVESALCKQSIRLEKRKTTELSRVLARLRKANAGNYKAFQHILDLAYGRKGKLWWELMEPFTAQPHGTDLPPPIIRNVEKSRPPVYSPALTALLLSQHSRSTKPLARQNIRVPPSIADRVGPDTRDSQFLGPLSKRREVNSRWRYFREEARKVIPPLEFEGVGPTGAGSSALMEAPLQHASLLTHLHDMAGQVGAGPPRTRRERLSKVTPDPRAIQSEDSSLRGKSQPLPTRFLRRGYQALLGRIPRFLVKANGGSPNYEVAVSTSAITTRIRSPPHRLPELDPTNAAWLDASVVRSNNKT